MCILLDQDQFRLLVSNKEIKGPSWIVLFGLLLCVCWVIVLFNYYFTVVLDGVLIFVYFLYILPFLTPFFVSRIAQKCTHLDGTDCSSTAEQLWVRDICSRSLHSNCLERGLNPFSPPYRPTALTNRSPCLRIIMGEKLVHGCYAVTWGRFGPATPCLHVSDHTATPPRSFCLSEGFQGSSWTV